MTGYDCLVFFDVCSIMGWFPEWVFIYLWAAFWLMARSRSRARRGRSRQRSRSRRRPHDNARQVDKQIFVSKQKRYDDTVNRLGGEEENPKKGKGKNPKGKGKHGGTNDKPKNNKGGKGDPKGAPPILGGQLTLKNPGVRVLHTSIYPSLTVFGQACIEAASIGVRTNRQLLCPLALFLGDISAWSAASAFYMASADIRNMEGINGFVRQNFELKSKLNELSGLIRVSNIGKYLLSGIGAFSTLDSAQVHCVHLPFPTDAPDDLSNPEPDFDDDAAMNNAYDQARVYWPDVPAGAERFAADAYKVAPALWLWVRYMRVRQSPWARVLNEIQRFFFGGVCAFTERMLLQMRIIYSLSFSLWCFATSVWCHNLDCDQMDGSHIVGRWFASALWHQHHDSVSEMDIVPSDPWRCSSTCSRRKTGSIWPFATSGSESCIRCLQSIPCDPCHAWRWCQRPAENPAAKFDCCLSSWTWLWTGMDFIHHWDTAQQV